jgi:hypothetical protein
VSGVLTEEFSFGLVGWDKRPEGHVLFFLNRQLSQSAFVAMKHDKGYLLVSAFSNNNNSNQCHKS